LHSGSSRFYAGNTGEDGCESSWRRHRRRRIVAAPNDFPAHFAWLHDGRQEFIFVLGIDASRRRRARHVRLSRGTVGAAADEARLSRPQKNGRLLEIALCLPQSTASANGQSSCLSRRTKSSLLPACVALKGHGAGDGQRASMLRHQVMILENAQRASHSFA